MTATVSVTLLDAANASLATLFSEWRPAGRHLFAFTADAIPDGAYTIAVTVTSARARDGANAAIRLSRAPPR